MRASASFPLLGFAAMYTKIGQRRRRRAAITPDHVPPAEKRLEITRAAQADP
ncbi:MAG: hypothetical protein HND42_07930 [Armatimonadetes bacterium]|nr:hypothetical protein [Armatimonadota bacterium]